jgi:hypothetical protein
VAVAVAPHAVEEASTVAPAAVAPQTAEAVATAAPVLDFGPERGGGLNWPDDPQGVAWFAADGYHLAARRPGQFVSIGVLPEPLRDVAVAATFRKAGGPAGGGYGLIVRDQGPGPRDGLDQGGSYIVFEAGDKGEVGIWRRQQDQWLDILGWTPTPAMRPGVSAENALEVRAQGDALTFIVNGTTLPIQTSAQPVAGGVGVFLGGDGNEAVLSRLSVTRLD